jgi:RNA polymerase sigma-70 factor (ECF subfamily)
MTLSFHPHIYYLNIHYMDQSIELQWLERLREGDKAALKYFINTRGPDLLGFATDKLKNLQEAEDIVQEVFIKLWRCRTTFTPPINAWIYAVTYRACIDVLRKRSIHKSLQTEGFLGLLRADERTEYDEDRKEVLRILRSRSEELSPAVREAFKMRFFDELEVKDIARILRKDEQTIRNQINHAIKTLRGQLSKIKFF